MTIVNIKNISVSTDPEMLVLKDGVPHHVIDVLEGYDKWNTMPVEGGAIQPDNVAFEFNTVPATTAQEFSERIVSVIKQGTKILPKGYTLKAIASHSFENIEEFPSAAFVFGCDPDFNAYTGHRNPSPRSDDPNLRSFGGHVHLDIPVWDINEEAHRSVVLACDCLMGLWSTSIDKDSRRKELYGKASAYRPKSYGVEYRTMSNFWVASAPYRKTVFDLAVLASNISDYDKLQRLVSPITSLEEVIEVINKHDMQTAGKLFKLFKKKAITFQSE